MSKGYRAKRLLLASLQPLMARLDDIADRVADVGAVVAELLAGDERGHVPEHLQSADRAMVALVEARRVIPAPNSIRTPRPFPTPPTPTTPFAAPAAA